MSLRAAESNSFRGNTFGCAKQHKLISEYNLVLESYQKLSEDCLTVSDHYY